MSEIKIDLPNRHYFIVHKDGIAFGRDARDGAKTLYTLARSEAEQVCEAWRASPHSARCEWTQTEDGQWDTACGEVFEFVNGGPADNGAKFCQYCGLPVREVRAKA